MNEEKQDALDISDDDLAYIIALQHWNKAIDDAIANGDHWQEAEQFTHIFSQQTGGMFAPNSRMAQMFKYFALGFGYAIEMVNTIDSATGRNGTKCNIE